MQASPAMQSTNGAARKGDDQRTFDIHNRSRVKHQKIGPYDLYEEIPQKRSWIPFIGWERLKFIRDNTGPILRFARELAQMPEVLPSMIIHFAAAGVTSIIPAVSLWYSTQMLKLIQEVFDTRTLDSTKLKFNILGGIACALAKKISHAASAKAARILERNADLNVARRVLRVKLSLDLPSSEDQGISSQLSIFQRGSPWDDLSAIISLAFLIFQSLAQFFVFALVLYQEPSMIAYAVVCLTPLFFESHRNDRFWFTLNMTMEESKHEKEIRVGNLQDYLLNKWVAGSDSVKDVEKSFFQYLYDHQCEDHSILKALLAPKRELGDIVLLVQALRSPATLPASFATLTLIRSTINTLYGDFGMLRLVTDFTEVLNDFRRLYELENIPKMIVDGNVPFAKDSQQLGQGLSIEFRNVSFKYPKSDTDRYALKNASFKVEKGQLCVIVGTNGSGKSTLMKLLLRLYDPSEGNILINGQDIRTLNIKDVRSSVATLFQDFTLFPFSIRENIALGSPEHMLDDDLVERAAELGGCTNIIDRFPQRLESFLKVPSTNWFHRIPGGTKTLFGSKNLHRFAAMPGLDNPEENKLSGGEEQRLALARCFMRTLSEEDRIALLLFDEPSAALDPGAEYDLFERLRKLRGSKTMLFSSHRFGNLTRHADCILYMKDSEILEQGSHSELIKLDGGYASMYKIQASAFQD